MSTTFAATSRHAALEANPAWTQLLGLCPLLAVSSSIANALGLALASAMVLIGSNTLIAVLRHRIPQYARLPCFVLIIASFTTVAVLLMQAFAYELYVRIALFIQIIVTNCMILGRAEAFASRQPVPAAFAD
ncbi:MAG: Rnf-Nqr domain containing protein, partial [Gammaproteobacteria bacterium]